jgi:hypothetical protein
MIVKVGQFRGLWPIESWYCALFQMAEGAELSEFPNLPLTCDDPEPLIGLIIKACHEFHLTPANEALVSRIVDLCDKGLSGDEVILILREEFAPTRRDMAS